MIVAVPLFVTVDLSGQFRFDSDPFNRYGMPAIPIGLLFLLIFVFRINIIPKKILAFSFGIMFMASLNIFDGGVRSAALSIGSLIPVFTYYCIRLRAQQKSVNIDKLRVNVFLGLSAIVVVKLISSLWYGNPSSIFIIEEIRIYNYYDYFSFLPLVVLLLAIDNLFKREKILISCVILIVALIEIHFSTSRYFFACALASPLVYTFFKLVPLSSLVISGTSFTIVVSLTWIGALHQWFEESSMVTRTNHWKHYLESITIIDVFYPVGNDYRQSVLDGSFHNEFIDIFSFFGFGSFLIFWIWLYVVKDSSAKNPLLKTILFFLVFGMLIQINITNFYVGMIVGSIFAIYENRNFSMDQSPTHIDR